MSSVSIHEARSCQPAATPAASATAATTLQNRTSAIAHVTFAPPRRTQVCLLLSSNFQASQKHLIGGLSSAILLVKILENVALALQGRATEETVMLVAGRQPRRKSGKVCAKTIDIMAH